MDFQPIIDQWRLVVQGLQVTAVTSIAAAAISIALGLFLGVLSQFGHRSLYLAIRAFVYIFRGVPVIVLLFLVFYGLPSLGLNLPGLVVGTVALGLNSAGYMTEVARSALESIDPSQKEAAAIDGASFWVTMIRVVVPQAAQRMIPSGTNQIINLVKGTSLLSVISITDVTRASQLIAASDFEPFEAYISLAVLYLVVVSFLTRASMALERWVQA